jgi:hypothetical protein
LAEDERFANGLQDVVGGEKEKDVQREQNSQPPFTRMDLSEESKGAIE